VTHTLRNSICFLLVFFFSASVSMQALGQKAATATATTAASPPASPGTGTSSGGTTLPLVVYDPSLGPVTVPFDQAFILQLKGFPANANIIHVNVYKKTNYHGERKFVHTKAELKTGSTSYGPHFFVPFKSVTGGLNLTFPAIKPNSSFDVAVETTLSDNQVKAYLALNKAIRSKNQKKIDQCFKVTLDSTSYIFPTTGDTIYSSGDYHSFKLYKEFYCDKLDTPYNCLLSDPTKYQHYQIYAAQDLQTVTRLLDTAKLNDYGTYMLNGISADSLQLGLQALNDKLSDHSADLYDFDARLLNFNKDIRILDSINVTLTKLQKRSLNPAVATLAALVAKNSKTLQNNRDTLTKYYSAIKSALAAGDATNYTWMVSNNGAKDVSTLSGSILSTEFGMTNLFVKDNTNKTVYIPKLFIGVDIFFRQTNRDIKSKDLPWRSDLKKVYGKDGVPDLWSTNTVWQHLSLSLGLTLGSMPAHFDSFYNTFSLTAGPSYRFCRYLRLSGGVAFLKRQNPNPVLLNEPVALGYYASFSVDMNFIKAASDFFSMITK